MALEERKGPIDLAFLGSRRRWHGDPSVLIMKYLAALIAFCCINLKTAKALGLAALAAGERRRSDRVRTSSAAVHESGMALNVDKRCPLKCRQLEDKRTSPRHRESDQNDP